MVDLIVMLIIVILVCPGDLISALSMHPSLTDIDIAQCSFYINM